ncbi:MAG: hypothetical protein HKM93_11370 [Desulfobacteraceae bacterium]|nr:hypothetical protein [Desulfobacteraceae bacterium]
MSRSMGLKEFFMDACSPNCRVILIGSLPFDSHAEAVKTIFEFAPDFPVWPQLPMRSKEGMVRQFLSGMPGLVDREDRFFIDSGADGFETQMAGFYESYFKASDDDLFLKDSRFALEMDTAAGFFDMVNSLEHRNPKPVGIKGQVTGPVTTGIGVTDQRGRNIFFDDNLLDVMVKLLALKAKWQVLQLKPLGCEQAPMIFIDEPGIVSFGSSAYISISREMVMAALQEIIDTIHQAGGLAGIHICANGDFSLVLESDTDAISFDAYSYFDNLVLYKQQLLGFLEKGGMLAWGIVPTLDPEAVDMESTETLMERFEMQLDTLIGFGVAGQALLHQTFVAPACGAGALTTDRALKVLEMTRNISQKIQYRIR